jgi:hypothetical protein
MNFYLYLVSDMVFEFKNTQNLTHALVSYQ